MFKGFGFIGIAIVILFTGLAIFAPIISPYAPNDVVTEQLRLPPAWDQAGQEKYLLGTDDLGRDQFSRIIYGARITMFMGFMVVIVSTLIGVSLGLLAGSLGGLTDLIITRTMDIFMALPSVLFAIVILTILGPGLGNTILAVAIMALPSIVRITRGVVMGEMKKNYVVAAKSYGAGWIRIAVVNVLPNCLAPIVVQVALGFSDAVLNTAALGALGLGAQPPTPEWGTMLADARGFIESSPHLVTVPGLCILLVVVGFNLFGDSLRDHLDPKLRKIV